MYYPQDGYTETRQYNANLQLTRLTATPQSGTGIDIEYDYASPTNGRVSQTKDWITGSQVTYTYDSLNRLTQAITTDPPQGQNWGVQWGLSFAYDGFGNLLQQTAVKGTPPSMSLGVDATTNRINSTGYQYDANGNLTTLPGGTTYTYDVANRIVSNGGSLSASYNPSNQRIWDGTYLYYYGVGGELLERYQPTFGSTSTWARDGGATIWFGGKLIRYRGQWVMTDLLGSVRANEGGERFDFYPYGGEISPTSDGRPKFGTFFRDSAGQDYALNRYYGPGIGRFLSPDLGTAVPGNPGSWNRYGYVLGDPVNLQDRMGLNADDEDEEEADPEGVDVGNAYVFSGGGGGGADLVVPQTLPCFSSSADSCGGSYGVAVDVALNPTAQQVFGQVNQMNPGGFINFAGSVMATGYLGGAGLASLAGALGVPAVSTVAASGTTAVAAAESPQGQQAIQTMTSVLESGLNETQQVVSGYQIAGNQGLVGNTYNMNLWGLYAAENAEGIPSLVQGLRSVASSAGADQISILGSQIINPGLINLNPAVALRFGLTLTQINQTTILLQGPVQ